MDDTTIRGEDPTIHVETVTSTEPSPSVLDDVAPIDDSPDVDDDGVGFEEDLEYILEKNAEAYRRLAQGNASRSTSSYVSTSG